MMTRSRALPPVFLMASASTSEVATASEPWMASSLDVHALVGAHLQGLLDGVGGLVGADRQDGDLTLAGLDDLEGLLDGVLVELGQQAVDVLAVGRVVGCVERALGLGVRART